MPGNLATLIAKSSLRDRPEPEAGAFRTSNDWARRIFISTASAATSVMVSRVALDGACQFAAPKQNILILGTQELAVTVARELERRDDLNLQLVGFVLTAGIPGNQQELLGHPIVGTADNLPWKMRTPPFPR